MKQSRQLAADITRHAFVVAGAAVDSLDADDLLEHDKRHGRRCVVED